MNREIFISPMGKTNRLVGCAAVNLAKTPTPRGSGRSSEEERRDSSDDGIM